MRSRPDLRLFPLARLARLARLVALATLLTATIAVGLPGPRAAAAVYPGCTIDTTYRVGSRGDGVNCIERALRAKAYQWSAIDTEYGTVTVIAVKGFQQSKGLPATGVVDAQTARALGIWKGGGSSGGTPAPSTSAPSTSSPGSATLPGCRPSGRSAVVDKAAQRFWLCRNGRAITGRLPMTSGSAAYGLPPVGTHTVSFKARTWWGGGEALSRFVAFYTSPSGNNIAFHQTVPSQPERTIGDRSWRGRSAGCLRLTAADSQRVWDFLQVGDKVVVISR